MGWISQPVASFLLLGFFTLVFSFHFSPLHPDYLHRPWTMNSVQVWQNFQVGIKENEGINPVWKFV